MSACSFMNTEIAFPTKSQVSISALPQGFVALLWILIPVAFHVPVFFSKIHCNNKLALGFVIIFVNKII